MQYVPSFSHVNKANRSYSPPKPSAVAAGGKRKPVTSDESESDEYETDTSSDE